MSAWMCSDAHIDAIVTSMLAEGLIESDQATEVGRAMKLENYRSLHARYGDPIPNDFGYEYLGTSLSMHDGKIGRLIGCFDYQACEHAEWTRSESCILIWKLFKVLGRKYGYDVDPDGEDIGDWTRDMEKNDTVSYPWGISKIEEAA